MSSSKKKGQTCGACSLWLCENGTIRPFGVLPVRPIVILLGFPVFGRHVGCFANSPFVFSTPRMALSTLQTHYVFKTMSNSNAKNSKKLRRFQKDNKWFHFDACTPFLSALPIPRPFQKDWHEKAHACPHPTLSSAFTLNKAQQEEDISHVTWAISSAVLLVLCAAPWHVLIHRSMCRNIGQHLSQEFGSFRSSRPKTQSHHSLLPVLCFGAPWFKFLLVSETQHSSPYQDLGHTPQATHINSRLPTTPQCDAQISPLNCGFWDLLPPTGTSCSMCAGHLALYINLVHGLRVGSQEVPDNRKLLTNTPASRGHPHWRIALLNSVAAPGVFLKDPWPPGCAAGLQDLVS